MRNFGKYILIIAVFALALATFVLVQVVSKRNSAKEESLANAVSEAKAIEDELADLRSQALDLSESVTYTGDKAYFMIGFDVAKDSDFEYIEGLAKTYGFTPIIVLDCCKKLSTIAAWADEAINREWKIMLTATEFDEDANATVLDMREYISEKGAADVGIFLLYLAYDTDSSKMLLQEDGFLGYTLRSSNYSVDYGQTEAGLYYFDFAYVMSDATVSTRTEAAVTNKAPLLEVFCMKSFASGSLSQDSINTRLQAILDAGDEATFAPCADVVALIAAIPDELARLEAEQAAEKENVLAEIEKLKADLEKIYEQVQ